MSDARYRKVCLQFVDYSPEDTLDYSQGVESFDQFSQIAWNNVDKARVYNNDQKHN